MFQLGLNPEFCFVALDSQDQLVGLLGFRIEKNQLLNLKRREFQQVFGPFSGLFRFLITSLIFARKASSGTQILMDGVAVSAEVRGQGVGSKLFSEFLDFAKLKGFESVRLDVIDENPRAKSLYEKMGFSTYKYLKTPWPINNLIGVSGVTTMILNLDLIKRNQNS